MATLLHLFIIVILSISILQNNINVFVHSQCLYDQRSLLLQFKQTHLLDSEFPVKLMTWNSSTDCCSWGGVTCNFNGHVIGLDLSYQGIVSGVDDSSTLFNLQYLQRLNLANNHFLGQEMPTKFNRFVNLSYLNLHNTRFVGQVPMKISNLTKLLILDLSKYFSHGNYLMLLDLRMLVQNLSRLTELYLDGVCILTKGKELYRALSSSLPNLRVLSLSGCELSGPIDSSLQNLRFLSVINLSYNNLSSSIPDFVVNFSNLSSLILCRSGLHGTVSEKTFQVPTLKTLDLSNNDQLHGSLPGFYHNAYLKKLDLLDCKFSRIIPSSISNLKELVDLNLSFNNLSGHIPSISFLKKLTMLSLSGNKVNGSISYTSWRELLGLTYLDLSDNSFSGEIPYSLFGISRLIRIDLSHNQFTGLLNGYPNLSSSQLYMLDLSCNRIHGGLPSWIWEMRNLETLNVSYNFLTEVGKPSESRF